MLQILEEFLTTWPLIAIGDLLRYTIPAGLLTLVSSLFARRLARRQIQASVAGSDDRRREFAYSMLTVLIFSVVGFGIHLGHESNVLRITDEVPGLLEAAATFVVMLVAHDAYFYWTHRLMHQPKLFRYVHRTHHRSRTPTPLAAYAFAPAEAVVQALFLPIYLLFVETAAATVVAFLIHMIVRNVAGHAGIELFPRGWTRLPLLRAVTTTTHHDLHHEQQHWNYGLYFTWWDRWMGTEHPDYHNRFAAITGTTPRRTRRSTGLETGAIVIACLCSVGAPDARAEDRCAVTGRWATAGFGAVVEVSADTSRRALTARVVWVFDPEREDAVGAELFHGLRRDGCTWTRGRISNPENGRNYRGSVRLSDAGDLAVSGCIGPFCQTQLWRPYAEAYRSLPPLSLSQSNGKPPVSDDPAPQPNDRQLRQHFAEVDLDHIPSRDHVPVTLIKRDGARPVMVGLEDRHAEPARHRATLERMQYAGCDSETSVTERRVHARDPRTVCGLRHQRTGAYHPVACQREHERTRAIVRLDVVEVRIHRRIDKPEVLTESGVDQSSCRVLVATLELDEMNVLVHRPVPNDLRRLTLRVETIGFETSAICCRPSIKGFRRFRISSALNPGT